MTIAEALEVCHAKAEGPAVEGYVMTAGDKHIRIDIYLPYMTAAVFLKRGYRNLPAETITPLISMGFLVANVSDAEQLEEFLTKKPGQLVGRLEMYMPMKPEPVKREKKQERPDDEAEIRRLRKLPDSPEKELALAYFCNKGPDGFTQSERDRSKGLAKRQRWELVKNRQATWDELDQLSQDELEDRYHMYLLGKSIGRQPDVDGDFDKSSVTDC